MEHLDACTDEEPRPLVTLDHFAEDVFSSRVIILACCDVTLQNSELDLGDTTFGVLQLRREKESVPLGLR
jgi:hypothetical protein